MRVFSDDEWGTARVCVSYALRNRLKKQPDDTMVAPRLQAILDGIDNVLRGGQEQFADTQWADIMWCIGHERVRQHPTSMTERVLYAMEGKAHEAGRNCNALLFID